MGSMLAMQTRGPSLDVDYPYKIWVLSICKTNVGDDKLGGELRQFDLRVLLVSHPS